MGMALWANVLNAKGALHGQQEDLIALLKHEKAIDKNGRALRQPPLATMRD
ncbi:hypothetical protein [Jannaschia aquimarina]|uniref:Uncharacterized protein n=1 Tax=Jannaschia aquimarina TaxID=935700 RepID=A0A0D1CNT6_9RHOB|nr:hypothetical protein [Jannaschia aquimarina]KIT16387.1 hypothetical protein jaqu_18720 [Jannaschia aquimarina]SNT05374.1 hypothetical protein SAMN05421775_10544 [Jannaschia aquimarina]